MGHYDEETIYRRINIMNNNDGSNIPKKYEEYLKNKNDNNNNNNNDNDIDIDLLAIIGGDVGNITKIILKCLFLKTSEICSRTHDDQCNTIYNASDCHCINIIIV